MHNLGFRKQTSIKSEQPSVSHCLKECHRATEASPQKSAHGSAPLGCDPRRRRLRETLNTSLLWRKKESGVLARWWIVSVGCCLSVRRKMTSLPLRCLACTEGPSLSSSVCHNHISTAQKVAHLKSVRIHTQSARGYESATKMHARQIWTAALGINNLNKKKI